MTFYYEHHVTFERSQNVWNHDPHRDAAVENTESAGNEHHVCVSLQTDSVMSLSSYSPQEWGNSVVVFFSAPFKSMTWRSRGSWETEERFEGVELSEIDIFCYHLTVLCVVVGTKKKRCFDKCLGCSFPYNGSKWCPWIKHHKSISGPRDLFTIFFVFWSRRGKQTKVKNFCLKAVVTIH